MSQCHHPMYKMCIKDVKIPSAKSVTHIILAQIFGLQNLLPVCSYTSNVIEKQWYFMTVWTEKRTCIFCFMKRKEMKLSNTSNPFNFSRDNYSLLLPLSVNPTVFQFSPFCFLSQFYIHDLIFTSFKPLWIFYCSVLKRLLRTYEKLKTIVSGQTI